MPHLKCTACKIRTHSAHCAVGEVEELCPGCGSQLDPAGSLDELVGFRARSPSANDGGDDRWDIAVAAALEVPDAR